VYNSAIKNIGILQEEEFARSITKMSGGGVSQWRCIQIVMTDKWGQIIARNIPLTPFPKSAEERQIIEKLETGYLFLVYIVVVVDKMSGAQHFSFQEWGNVSKIGSLKSQPIPELTRHVLSLTASHATKLVMLNPFIKSFLH